MISRSSKAVAAPGVSVASSPPDKCHQTCAHSNHASIMPCDSSGSFIDAPSDEDDFYRSKECKTESPISDSPAKLESFESQREHHQDTLHVPDQGMTLTTDRGHYAYSERDVSFVTEKLPESGSRPRTDSFRAGGTENRQEAVAKKISPMKVSSDRLIGIISTPNRYMGANIRGTTYRTYRTMHSHHDTAGTLHTDTTNNTSKNQPSYQLHGDDHRVFNEEPDRVNFTETPRRISLRGDSFERNNIQERGNGNSTGRTRRHTFIPRSMLAASMKLKTVMLVGAYFLMVTFTTDFVIFSNFSRPWSSQISIQRPAAYGVGHGREIVFPPTEANENVGTFNSDVLEVSKQRLTGNSDTSDRQQENSSKPLNGNGNDNRAESPSINRDAPIPFNNEGKNLRRPQLAFARATKIQKSAPIFRPPEPLLKDMQDQEQRDSTETEPIEKFVLKDLGPIGSLHEDTEGDEIGIGTIVGVVMGLGSALCLSLMLFIGGLREARRRWDVFQAQRLWLQSQRSR